MIGAFNVRLLGMKPVARWPRGMCLRSGVAADRAHARGLERSHVASLLAEGQDLRARGADSTTFLATNRQPTESRALFAPLPELR